jgi:hypothetical protein
MSFYVLSYQSLTNHIIWFWFSDLKLWGNEALGMESLPFTSREYFRKNDR